MTGITTTVDGVETGSKEFGYDDAGRMTSRDLTVGSDTTAETLSWDPSSNLTQMVIDNPGTEPDVTYWFVYDESGQRVAKFTDTQARGYLADTELFDDNTGSNGPTATTRFYTFGGASVATHTVDKAGQSSWALLLGDFQGSASVSMPLTIDTGMDTNLAAATEAVQVSRNAYTPYGAHRGTDDLTIERDWLNQIHDGNVSSGGTGLTYLNARYYDNTTGRFLTPDPLMDPKDPRTLDPYRYSENNPVHYSDTSGRSSSCSYYYFHSPGGAYRYNMNTYGVDAYAACTSADNYAADGVWWTHSWDSSLGRGTFLDGVRDSVIGTVSGAYWAVTHPDEAAAAIYHAVTNPVETARNIGHAYAEAYREGGWDYVAGLSVGDIATGAVTGGVFLNIAKKTLAAIRKTPNGLDDALSTTGTQPKGGAYELVDGDGNTVRTGRTKDHDRRKSEHERDPVLGEYIYRDTFRTDDYFEQRGLEHYLYQHNPGALAGNGGYNFVRPIAASNPKFDQYMSAANNFLGGGR